MPLVQETCRFKPVHLGHYEIHQCDVRRVNVKGCQRMVPTEGFPNYDPFGTPLQSHFESAPCRRAVIDYKDTDQENSFRCRRLLGSGRACVMRDRRRRFMGFAPRTLVGLTNSDCKPAPRSAICTDAQDLGDERRLRPDRYLLQHGSRL